MDSGEVKAGLFSTVMCLLSAAGDCNGDSISLDDRGLRVDGDPCSHVNASSVLLLSIGAGTFFVEGSDWGSVSVVADAERGESPVLSFFKGEGDIDFATAGPVLLGVKDSFGLKDFPFLLRLLLSCSTVMHVDPNAIDE